VSKVEARKVDRHRRKSNQPNPQMVRRQPAKKSHKIGLWMWLGVGAIVAFSAAAGAFLASLTAAPLQQRALSAADDAFFKQNGKEAFSRSLLQVPEVSKPVNILLLGIKTNISDVKNSSGRDRKKAGYDAEVDSLDGLSDTIMLLRFDPQTKRTIFLGIPRDTKIDGEN
jgi:polyisoprenyl-teichoic acid--peptidoglycan teichoic acid transferase